MKSIIRGWKPLSAALAILMALLGLSMLSGCSDEYPDNVYNPNDQGEAVPVISSVTPPSVLAGVDPVEITVSNLNPVDSLNKIYFNNSRGTLISITDNGTTKVIRIYPPLIQSDSTRVRIMAPGALNYGEYSGRIKISLAAIEYGGFGDKDDPIALGCDKNENVYVTFADKTVRLVTPNKTAENTIMATNIAPANATLMKVVGQNFYFSVTKTLYRQPLTGGTAEKINSKLVTEKIMDFDFVPDGSLYFVMKNGIGRMLSDGSWTSVSEYKGTTLVGARVYSGALYVASKDSVWKNPINADGTLGAKEVIFDAKGRITNAEILSITIATNGDIYLGNKTGVAVYKLALSGGAYPMAEPFYPLVLVAPGSQLFWGTGDYMYVMRDHATDVTLRRIIRVYMQQRGAPDYGRDL